ncbi:hypothetical protein PSAB6_60307 [Paraburkholderia sabiae]|nr:hypothetical protein PSAB6_60307 [Paraburkholderia sabiae]
MIILQGVCPGHMVHAAKRSRQFIAAQKNKSDQPVSGLTRDADVCVHRASVCLQMPRCTAT